MIKDKETFLKQVALLPDLKGSKLSLVFAMHPTIDISKKEKFFENVSSYFILQKEDAREKLELKGIKKANDIESWLGKDLRIKQLKLKSVRGFPNSNIPFGINFLGEKNQPESMIILGSNGSGKSSIYNSIEYNYCKKIGEAQLRTTAELKDEAPEFKDYLSHFSTGFSNSICDIETVDEIFTLQSLNIPKDVRDKINPNTHFISDYDIYYNGKLDYLAGGNNSFHNLVAESLGLSELLVFERNLRAFVAYPRRTETLKINALEKSIKEERQLVETNLKSVEEKKQKLIQLTDSQKEQPEDNKVQELQKQIAQIKQSNFSFQYDYTTLHKNIAEYEQKYKEFSALELKAGNISQIQFFNLGLELLKVDTDCPFCNSSNKSTTEINAYVSDKIKQIETFNKASQELTRALNITTENLDSLFNQVALLKGKVAQENNSIKTISEFSELASSENSFIAFVEAAQSNEFYSIGAAMNENEKFKLNKNQFLFSFFETHKEYINTELKSFIDTITKFAGKRNEVLANIEKQLAANLQSKTLFEQIVTVKNEITALEQQVEASNRKIKNNDEELKNFREQQAVFNEIKEEARTYSTHFHTLLNKEVQQAFIPIQFIVEDVIKTYLENEDRNVDFEIRMKEEEVDTDTGEVLSEIITAYIVPKDKSNPTLPVNKYFNTFHFRLFSTMVGVSIAMASRINTKINLPLVLDDIFYASDFENRATIERFIKELFEVFDKYTHDLELQLILFTHDQLIFESAVKATAERKVKNIAFAKLFPYENAKDKGDYKELVYRMPSYLPYTIMQNTLTTV
jgi:hypothetical protein